LLHERPVVGYTETSASSKDHGRLGVRVA
jgi:hypothetical protein